MPACRTMGKFWAATGRKEHVIDPRNWRKVLPPILGVFLFVRAPGSFSMVSTQTQARFWILAAFSFCFVVAGCGGPGGGTVTGKVTLNKKPLAAGNLVFVGEDGKTAQTQLKSDGSYKAENVPVGDDKVYILPAAPMPEKASEGVDIKAPPKDLPKIGPPPAPPAIIPIPDKYQKADTSGLKYTIKS